MPAPTIRSFARALTLAPLALIVHVGAAAAGEFPTVSSPANTQHSARVIGDAQESARQVLLGVTRHAPTLPTPDASNAPNAQHSARARGDAQESARQLLLGATIHSTAGPSPEVSRTNGTRRHGDAQLYAQHLLLGRRDGSEAGL
jgi:hypothetical protein